MPLLPFVLVSVFALAPAPAPAPDLNATWSLTGSVEGVTFMETCALVQADTKLSGTCKDDIATHDVTGTVAEKSVTFSHASQYEGQALTLSFAGHLDDTGALSGTVDVQPMGYSGTFSATKATPPAPTPATPPPPAPATPPSTPPSPKP
jgi:hypothetical protein